MNTQLKEQQCNVLNPRTLLAKGTRSVPVVEVGGHRLVGNSTTEQLAGLIALGQLPELKQASQPQR